MRKTMKKAEVEMIFGVVIGVIVAVLMLSLIWGMQTTATSTEGVINESFTAVANTWITLDNPDIVEGTLTVENQTDGVIGSGNYTVDYTLGRINVTDDLNYNTSYTYEPVGYIDSPMARLVVGFIAVMLAVGIIVYLAKKE